ncbi:hypothetical protein K523DRAFT_317926 [Schizophyllum commune Tattone D]|nr:hypothetical protein K523DRAFT_317926 [Schizophyllum commune Tattone D]
MAVGSGACTICGKIYKVRGMRRHLAYCREQQREKDQERNEKLRAAQPTGPGPASTMRMLSKGIYVEGIRIDGDTVDGDILPPLPPESPPPPSPPPSEVPTSSLPKLGDVKIEYHPSSGKPPVIVPLQDLRREGDEPGGDRTPRSAEPWVGFRTRLDYEISEFILQTRLNTEETKRLLKLVKCAQDTRDFTIASIDDLNERWQLAAQATLVPGYKTTEFTSEGEGYKETFEVHHTSLLDWARSLVTDPALKDHMVYDARRMFIHNGEKFERWVDEPYTADRLWNIQSTLDSKKSPLGFVLYADKNKLSSFSGQKGYPVEARLINLDTRVRNGEGRGGACIVGLLPIPDETSERKNKTRFVNYKGIIWHDSMREFLQDIINQPPEGIPIKCSDDVIRFFVLFILILVADYEEHAVIGTEGHAPSAEQREQILSAVSLRPVPNVFWKMPHSGPYPALCFDTLHFVWAGLAEHLSEQLKLHIKQVPGQTRSMTVKVNKQVDVIPRWRDLHHMDNFMEENFNDGSKHEDASKATVIGMHGIFTPSSSEFSIASGYQLLRAYRYYLEMAMFACMDVVTESRSDAGRQQLSKFHDQLTVYRQLVARDPILGSKGWNFPKIHLHAHLFDSIWDKGVTRVQSTKPFEKLHGPIRKIYLEQTNFKNVPRQILNIIHRHSIARIIRDDIDRLDESTSEEKESSRTSGVDNVLIGSPDPAITFDTLEQLMNGDRAFTNFRVRLQNALHRILPLFFGVESRPNRSLVAFSSGDKIRPFKYLQVEYSSQVDWRLTRDYLRCNPNFHHRPRYDCVLLSRPDPIFARLLYVFTCTFDGKDYPIALVQAYDAPCGHVSKVDKELGLVRRRARPRQDTEFVSLHSIIRGAVMIQDLECQEGDEYLLYNYLDSDMFLRTWRLVPDV